MLLRCCWMHSAVERPITPALVICQFVLFFFAFLFGLAHPITTMVSGSGIVGIDHTGRRRGMDGAAMTPIGVRGRDKPRVR